MLTVLIALFAMALVAPLVFRVADRNGFYVLAAVPAAAVGWGVFLLTGGIDGWTTNDKIFGALGAALIGTVTLVVYVGVLALFRTPELRPAIAIVQRFLPKR